jgi:hypothetical protein
MTVTIEDLSNLSTSLSGSAGEVWGAKWQLDSDMSGIQNAMGDDDQGKKFLASWNTNYKALLAGFDALANNIDAVSTSLSQAGDQLYKTESDTLKGFGITAVDPRPKPPIHNHGRNQAF